MLKILANAKLFGRCENFQQFLIIFHIANAEKGLRSIKEFFHKNLNRLAGSLEKPGWSKQLREERMRKKSQEIN